MREYVFESRVLVCVGSGGVGKTTISSAVAFLGASEGKKVLLFTIDPSRRLATCLGMDGWKGDQVSVQKFSNGGELFASMVNHQEIFDNFVQKNKDPNVPLEQVLENRLYKELTTSLSGSQEFTSLLSLIEAVRSQEFDLIVLDTPPAQHTQDFIKAPQVLFNLFSGPVMEWFSKITHPQKHVFKILNKGTQAAIKVLERITGTEFISELQLFFSTISFLSPSIQSAVIEAQEVLARPDTSFMIITNLDEARIIEAQENVKEFKRLGFSIKSIIVNRLTPHFENTEGVDPNLIEFYQKNLQQEGAQMNKLQNSRNFKIRLLGLPKILLKEDEIENLKTLSKSFYEIKGLKK